MTAMRATAFFVFSAAAALLASAAQAACDDRWNASVQYNCPYGQLDGKRPTEAQLAEGSLCNSDLRGLKLAGRDLSGRNLTYSKLEGANLSGADLGGADLTAANLSESNLAGARFGYANLRSVRLYGADASKAVFEEADFAGADMQFSNAVGADFTRAEFDNSRACRMNFDGASFKKANAKNTEFSAATFRGADLTSAQMPGIIGRAIVLDRARLTNADFTGADLEGASLKSAMIDGAILSGTDITAADLTGATYQPQGEAPSGLLLLKGLASVRFDVGKEAGLVKLREALRKNGLRDLEREATYALEHNRTEQKLRSGNPQKIAEAVFRLIFFEWTTGYGMRPGRPLLLLLVSFLLFTPLYRWTVSRADWKAGQGAIYRVLPRDRILEGGDGATFEGPVEANRVHADGARAWAWGAYFSLVSAFHIGFREINVGTWISRLQASKFSLEPVGWVRTVSGFQSLVSVYLVAMAILTYFGRPFD